MELRRGTDVVPLGQADRRQDRREDRRQGDRRQGDRRQGQAPVLHFRRASDRRMDDGQAAALLQRRALDLRVRPRPVPVEVVEGAEPQVTVDLTDRVVHLDAEPPVTGRCPECGAPCDPLWLVRHFVEAHPSWP